VDVSGTAPTYEATTVDKERRDYYRQLESAQRGSLDITTWLVWFLGCRDRTNDTALRDIRELLERGIPIKNPGGGRSTSYRLADFDGA